MRRIIAVLVITGLAGCGGHRAAAPAPPRSVGEVERAFADHGIRLALVQPEAGVRLRYRPLFGQSASLSVSVRVYPTVAGAHAESGALRARNVVVTWQGADNPSVEAAVDELR